MDNLHDSRDGFYQLWSFQIFGDSWIFILRALVSHLTPQFSAFHLLPLWCINTLLKLSCKVHLSILTSSFSHIMDYLWDPPEGEALKINVHCITTAEPLPNGNNNSVGVVVRNKAGQEVWSAAGPMPGKSKLQATLWGIYHGALQCYKLEKWKTHIKTDHWGTGGLYPYQA